MLTKHYNHHLIPLYGYAALISIYGHAVLPPINNESCLGECCHLMDCPDSGCDTQTHQPLVTQLYD